MAYFDSHRLDISVRYTEDEVNVQSLREAQAGAYWAICSHFTVKETPAVVVMPTGSGKTAVITLIPYNISNSRILIIVPSIVIKDQIEREFRTLQIARDTNCLPIDIQPPNIYLVTHQLSTLEQWQNLYEYDVIIATPRCVSPKQNGVYSNPPNDIFDTIIFDEAHHIPARTWNGLVQKFSTAKIVSFTATPYRNDMKLIPGDIVYSYPIIKAIEKNIYRPVELIPVSGIGTRDEKDNRLAQCALETLNQENLISPAKILVRVGRLKDTEIIQRLYANLGINLAIVSSEKTLSENEVALQQASHDTDCQGIISVGMLGEGLDLPILRIAVWHRPHQSFPATLQFIGRICRTAGSHNNTAKLIAIPEEIKTQIKDIFGKDSNWVQLIPDLADEMVREEQHRRQVIVDDWNISPQNNFISIHSIKPSYVVSIYEIQVEEININRIPEFRNQFVIHQSIVSENNWQLLIIKSTSKPLWSTSDSIQNIRYDLLIYYFHENFLFEFSTSKELGNVALSQIGGNSIHLVEKEKIERIVRQNEIKGYYNIGMRRVSTSSTNVPSYKLLTGKSAENTIRLSDGEFFSLGHLLGRMNWGTKDIVLGFSGDNGRIWSATRDHLISFISWCNELSERLSDDVQSNVPYLSHLKHSYRLQDRLPAQPYSIELHESFYYQIVNGLRLEITDQSGNTQVMENLELADVSINNDSWDPMNPNRCVFSFGNETFQMNVEYCLEQRQLFHLLPDNISQSCVFKVPDQGALIDLSLDEYFSQYPPIIFLVDGSVVISDRHFPYQVPNYNIPDYLFDGKNWENYNCEITIEDMNMVRNQNRVSELRKNHRNSVIGAAQVIIQEKFPERAIIFTDHHSGEIADFVVIDHLSEIPCIHFFHCKASETNQPGARQRDAYEVLAQARKCVRRIRNISLFQIIKDRLRSSPWANGTVEELDRLLNGFTPMNINYNVWVVQPGFSISIIKEWRDESIRILFLSLYDELKAHGVDFSIIGSQ